MKLVHLKVDLGPPDVHILERGEVIVEGALDGGVLSLEFLHQHCQFLDLSLQVADPLLIPRQVLRSEEIVTDHHRCGLVRKRRKKSPSGCAAILNTTTRVTAVVPTDRLTSDNN